MQDTRSPEPLTIDRRGFVGAAAAAIAATQLGAAPASPASSALKQIQAGELNVGYAESGPPGGQAVILLHGWPYDIHSYTDVAAILASHGYRVIVPFQRGYGTTTFLSSTALRNGQQTVCAIDVTNLMDALKLESAIIGGFDIGSRTAGVVAALWPKRCKALVSVSGYLITNVPAQKEPLPPKVELAWWYQFYFSTQRGVLGYSRYRYDFNKLIWTIVSPKWHFSEATYARTAQSFQNPDHVAIVIHNYRWRLGLAKGDPKYDSLETQLWAGPVITVPTVTIASDFDGPNASGAAYRNKFSGKYAHRILPGIGHNVPQEAPQAFAKAIVDADSLA